MEKKHLRNKYKLESIFLQENKGKQKEIKN